MTHRSLLFTLILSGIFLSSCSFLPRVLSPRDERPEVITTPIPSPVAVSDEVSLSFPQPGDTISSPLDIRGEAPGNWMFEGQMSLTLRIQDGPSFGTTTLKADGDWMTSEKVPFSGRLTFLPPANVDVAILVIEADNPSGLPENEKKIEIPVRLSQ